VSVRVLGHRVERREDPPLLTGAVDYLADLHPEGILHAVFVRRPSRTACSEG
jgi:CO/xanthine dehydrogenase Mo-binding subunit